MREIKFRVFSWGKMLYSDKYDFVIYGDGTPRKNEYGDMIGLGDESELMQYTGLKDQNGVDIYEGDVVRLEETFIGIVFYDNSDASFSYRVHEGLSLDNMNEEYCDTEAMSYSHNEKLEIIGNIYEKRG